MAELTPRRPAEDTAYLQGHIDAAHCETCGCYEEDTNGR